MTYRQAVLQLKNAGIDSPEWDAELLAEHFGGVNELRVLAEPDEELPKAFAEAVAKRADREPLQYLLGEWTFYRQTYRVTEEVLIPRSDTEILVEKAVTLLPKNAFFADFCTGSGCIAVSALAERKDTRALALDLSAPALRIAIENAKRNGVSDRFEAIQADLLKLPQGKEIPPLDAILSNPPYIRTSLIPTLSPEVQREPSMALDGGADGLIFYRKLLELGTLYLKKGGFCLFEIGFDQGEDLVRLSEESGYTCHIFKDYGGMDRVAYLTRNA